MVQGNNGKFILLQNGMSMYKTLNEHYQQRFGCKVYKLSIDAGFTCPNRDGTLGTGGCIFCSGDGGGEFAEKGCGSITRQLENARKRVEKKCKSGRFIAYFQSFTNTYGPVEVLRRCYFEAIEPEYIVGLAIGTRPDCLQPEIVELLAEINAIKPVSVEIGLQTAHEETAKYIRRGYDLPVYVDSVRRLKIAGLEVVTHIILGLPGETPQMMVETTRRAIEAGTDGVKFHLLHILRGTDLEKDYLHGKFSCLTMEEYGQILVQCLAVLPENVVVHRITGDGAKRNLVAPMWSADKKRVLNYLNRVIKA